MSRKGMAKAVTGLTVETLLKTATVPEEIKRVFRHSVGKMQTPDEMMWRDVAARMTLDALGLTPEAVQVRDDMDEYKYEDYRRAVNEARKWFLSPHSREDSELVFSYWNGVIEPVRRLIAELPAVPVPESLQRAVAA